MEEKKLYHCIVTWRIEDLHLYDRENHRNITSPIFQVGDSAIRWYLELDIDNENENVWFLIGKAASCKFLKNCYARYRLSWSNSDRVVWIGKSDQNLFDKRHVWGHAIKSREELFQSFVNDPTMCEPQTFICEMLFFEDSRKSTVGQENLHPNETSVDIQQISDDMRNFYLNNKLSDVRLLVKDGSIEAHKSILSARSPVFARILKEDSDRNSIDLPDVEFNVMNKMISFLYSGDFFDLVEEELPPIGLYELAEKFEIKDVMLHLHPDKIYARTEINTMECEHTWMIKSFTSEILKTKEYIQSSAFKLSNCSPEIKLGLRFGQHSNEPGNEEHLEVLVNGLSKYRAHKDSRIPFMVEISVIGVNEALCYKRRKVGCFIKERNCGFNCFIEKRTLINNSAQLLPHDSLTIRCYLKIALSGTRYSKIEKNCSFSHTSPHIVNSISVDLDRLYQEGIFSDVKIKIGDKIFPVHKFVLSARSAVFSKRFTENIKESEMEIATDDELPSVLEFLLRYIYSGKLGELTSDLALGLHRSAKKYDFPHLKMRCFKFLHSNMDVDSACDIFSVEDLYLDEELKALATKFICSHADLVFASRRGQELLSMKHGLAKELMIKLSVSYRCQRKKP